jgi:DNA-binding IclR family transcriptional regulator
MRERSELHGWGAFSVALKKKPKGEYSIQTVINALRVLDSFRNVEDFGVTELSTELGLHKNNVFRLLATLEDHGYVEQTCDERYRLGLRALELGQAFLRGRQLVRRARPVMEQLAADVRESVHLATLRELEVVFLDGVEADRLVKAGTREGQRLPVHCTAAGKVLMGFAPQPLRENLDRNISRSGLAAHTERTITDRTKFFDHLRSVASEGYAIDSEECEEGLVCAAAPVFGPTGEVVAALSISGPAYRLGEERVHRELAPHLVAAAGRLSRELGYSA